MTTYRKSKSLPWVGFALHPVSRGTFILKAERWNVTCNDLALTSRGQTGSRLAQTDSLLLRTYLCDNSILRECDVRDIHLREQKKRNLKIYKRDFKQEVNERLSIMR